MTVVDFPDIVAARPAAGERPQLYYPDSVQVQAASGGRCSSITTVAPIAAIREDLAAHGCSGAYAQNQLQPFASLQDLLPGHSRAGVPAIYGTDARAPLTHDALFNFITHFAATVRRHVPESDANCHTNHADQLNLSSHDEPSLASDTRIGVVLPNGPEVCG